MSKFSSIEDLNIDTSFVGIGALSVQILILKPNLLSSLKQNFVVFALKGSK